MLNHIPGLNIQGRKSIVALIDVRAPLSLATIRSGPSLRLTRSGMVVQMFSRKVEEKNETTAKK
jgi:hypothetical protein